MANRTYYIKETEAPALYPSVADKVIKLKVDAAGNTTIENSSELNGLVTLGPVQGDQKIQLKGASYSDRKSVVSGKSVDLGGRRIIKKKNYSDRKSVV